MPINHQELMRVLSELAAENNLRVALTGSLKGGLIAGVGATVGGLILGPIGIAFGGIFGSLYASISSQGSFKSVAHVILHDMTPHQQTMLAESCMKIIQDLRIEDVTILLPFLLNSPSAQQAVMQSIITFLTNEMKLQIID